jgi:hypothetical protein
LLDFLLSALAAPSPATMAGALGVAANCVWPLFGSRRRILAMQVLGSSLFGVHYLLLGAHTGAAMCVIGVLQGVAATTLRRGWARNSVFGATILAGLAITAMTWSGVVSVLAQGGQLLSAIGRMQRGQQAIRLVFLASEAFWTTHNTLVGSSWGLTSDAMAVAMLLVGLWRGRTRRPPEAAPVGAAITAARA